MGRTLQIRDVPETIHRELKARAAAAGLSLSDYTRAELIRVAERPAVSDVLRRAELRSGGASTSEIVSAARAGRDQD